MDEQARSKRTPGGTVQPLQPPAAARAAAVTRTRPTAVHYELRDPFAEVTYRADRFDDMAARADALGSMRFTAIGADGTRTQVRRTADGWPAPDTDAIRGVRDAPTPAAEATPPDPRAPPAPTDVALAPHSTPEPTGEPGASRDDADADRRAQLAQLEAALHERYVVRRTMAVGDLALGTTEYRYRGDTTRVAFTESRFRLATDHNSPSVARSMVDVAEARQWTVMRASGHDDFRRLVWLEATARGLRTLGYEPVPGDLEQLQRVQAARQVNRIEPERAHAGAGVDDAASAAKATGRGSGGRKAVIAALEAVLVARRVPARQREAVLAVAEEQLARRREAGQTHKVRVYDRSAAPQRPTAAPAREPQRTRERAAPVR